MTRSLENNHWVKEFTVKGNMGSDYIIKGKNLVNAIKENFKSIAKDNYIGNAAGYKLIKVSAQYQPNILGGKGGVELLISHTGLDLAHKPANGIVKQTKVWIYSNDKDFYHNFEISKK